MELDKYKEVTARVLQNLNDQGKVSEALAELTDDYTVITAQQVTARQELEKLKKDNESLRDTNMKLFLKVGVVEPQKTEPKPEAKPIDLKSFVDEHGNIK